MSLVIASGQLDGKRTMRNPQVTMMIPANFIPVKVASYHMMSSTRKETQAKGIILCAQE